LSDTDRRHIYDTLGINGIKLKEVQYYFEHCPFKLGELGGGGLIASCFVSSGAGILFPRPAAHLRAAQPG
jgi:hypothetical protein